MSIDESSGDGWRLLRGDCLAGLRTLADKSVDVTITDPPYEAEAHTEQRRVKRSGGIAVPEPLTFEPMTAALRAGIGAQIARVTKHCALVFCQVEAVGEWRKALEAGGMVYRRSIPWNKPDAMPSLHGRWPGQAFETIVLATRPGARPCPVGGKALSYTCCREHKPNGAPHPTTKPTKLMRDIVEDFTLPSDLVLDPFAGSGTTGVACRQLGRRFVGWELNDNYFEIACRRLRGDEAKPRPEQPSLFDALRSES